jgi:hypothetical protein
MLGALWLLARFVNAYLWHVDGNLQHHMRAGSIDEARERIAVTHGEDIARRAVIKVLQAPRTDTSESAAA